MDELLSQVRPALQPQCTSILTGRGYVEENLAGNNYSFRDITRMDKATLFRPVNLVKGAGLHSTPHISNEEKLIVHIQVLRGWTDRDISQRSQIVAKQSIKLLWKL